MWLGNYLYQLDLLRFVGHQFPLKWPVYIFRSLAASLSLATSTLAGTSPELKDNFYQQAKNYQSVFRDFLNEKTGMNMGGGMIMISHDDDAEEKEPIDPSEIPQFVFEKEPLSKSVNKAIPDLGLLFLFNCIFIAGAFISFNRFDAR